MAAINFYVFHPFFTSIFTALLSFSIIVAIAGEFMQLGSKENPDERFNHYLEKTYKKTASLIACCCKAVCFRYLFLF